MRKILFILLLTSCSTVPVKDHIIYGDEGKFGATAVHTLFTDTPPVFYTKADWDILRLGMVCTQASDLAEIQKTVDILCTQNPGQCNYEVQGKLKAAMSRLLSHQKRAGIKVDPEVEEAFR